MMQETAQGAAPGANAAIRVQVLAATGNAAFAEKIAVALNAHGYELSVGEFDPKEVDAAVILWSGASIASQEMLKAAALPLACNALIPVSIGRVEPPPAFRHLEPIDLAGWAGNAHDPRWRRVIDEIDKAAYAARLPADAPLQAPSSPWPRAEATKSRAPHAAILASFAVMGAAVAGGFYFLTQNRTENSGGEERTMIADAAPADAPRADAAPAPADSDDEPPVIALAKAAEPEATMPDAPKTIDAGAAAGGPADEAETGEAEGDAEAAQGDDLADLIASSVDDAANTDAPPAEQVASLALPETKAPAAGGEFRDCNFCPSMATIPAGSFMFGSPTGEPARQAVEGPVRKVDIPKNFAMAAHEVTFEEWSACVADGGCNAYAPSDAGWGRGKRPVINVSYADAKAYADWLSKKTGATYRLPTEAEWEYAARGGAATAFSFGSFVKPGQATFDSAHPYGGEPGAARVKTTPVASHQKNAFGLYDMHGNVWEWTADCWTGGHDAAQPQACKARVLKGGAWNTGGWRLRAAHRIAKNEAAREFDNGFRVVKELP